VVGTGRFLIVDKSRRASSDNRTRIGTCRSDSENFAAFWLISPIVAIRIVWLSAVVVTPSEAASSSRGLISTSGRRMSPATRGATSTLSPRICSTSAAEVLSSSCESEPDSITEIGRPVPPPPPPFNSWNVTRASGMSCKRGVSSRSNCWFEVLRSCLSVTKTRPLPSLTRSSADWTSGRRRTIRATSSATASVCASVVPGTISMRIWLKSPLTVGKNWLGITKNSPIVIRNETNPTPTIHIRWSR
jgi:hypothetical protein